MSDEADKRFLYGAGGLFGANVGEEIWRDFFGSVLHTSGRNVVVVPIFTSLVNMIIFIW